MRRFLPLVAAALLAAWMLWLARGPFDPVPEGDRTLAPMRLTEPLGPQPAFPRRFAWEEVPGTALYEISVANAETGATLFRQRGRVAGLDLSIDPASMPPPGNYVWQVEAFRGSHANARGVGRFTVAADPLLPGSP
jgi:hypothetical protein